MTDLVRLTDPREGADVIERVWRDAQPEEHLTVREVHRVLTADPGLVLATLDGTGVVAATRHSDGDVTRGHIRLLAVIESSRGRGTGGNLLHEAESWLIDGGATQIRWGAEVPWYLWPGIDSRWDPALSLATRAGYGRTGTAVNLALNTDFRLSASGSAPPQVHRLTSADRHRVAVARAMVARNWSPWLVEFDLAVESGTLFVAFVQDDPAGFMAHSTLRDGWLGPMGTDPRFRRRGIGAQVLAAACADLQQRGTQTAQIAWVGPVDYFLSLGARPSRTFVQLQRQV